MYCPSCGKETPPHSSYCLHCGRPILRPPSPAALPPSGSGSGTIVRGIVVAVIAVGGVIVVAAITMALLGADRTSGSTQRAAALPIPQILKPPARDLVKGWIQLGPGQFTYYQFTVEPGSYRGKVVGRFTAHGGSDDVNVVLLPAQEFADFQNHNSYRHYYNSGYIREGNINVTPPPGDYILIFNNRRALLTSKQVEAYVELRYE